MKDKEWESQIGFSRVEVSDYMDKSTYARMGIDAWSVWLHDRIYKETLETMCTQLFQGV